MNTFQITMLVLSGLLGVSVVAGPIWSYLQNMLPSRTKKQVLERLDRLNPTSKPSLVDIVKEWEDLRTLCNKAGLEKAVLELDELFPLLNKGDKDVSKT